MTYNFNVDELIEASKDARNLSYAPYSKYTVGAALLTKEGEIIKAGNIENASYGATNCAERTAIFKAVSEGKRDFVAIAISGSPMGEEVSQYAYPCGICRQVMREFVNPKSFYVCVSGPDNSYIIKTLEEILPESFGPENLN